MRPDWYTVNETLSDEEADYLIKLAEPKRERAGIGNRKEKTFFKLISDATVRNSSVFWFRSGENPEADALINRLVTIFMDVSFNYFGARIARVEPVQYTRYGILNHYAYHMDSGNMDGDRFRVMSASVELSKPNEYLNGGLEFRDHPNRRPKVSKGTMTCFPSLMIHRARPVFWGTRSSLVLWGSSQRDQELHDEPDK